MTIDKKIKFSHNYLKMPDGIDEVKLLQVFKIHYDELSEEFIEYDVRYIANCGVEHYKLPKTDLLVLLFQTYDRQMFTTIRRWTLQKEKYYRESMGEIFEVVMINEEK